MRNSMVVMLLCGSAVLAGDSNQKGHPHFDDHGTMRWFTKLADAQAVAKKEGKLVFIEYGRAG